MRHARTHSTSLSYVITSLIHIHALFMQGVSSSGKDGGVCTDAGEGWLQLHMRARPDTRAAAPHGFSSLRADQACSGG